jgi:hypothetical protein
MSIVERIASFLRARPDTQYCYDCIKRQLDLKNRSQVQRAISSIAFTDNFKRGQGLCHDCTFERDQDKERPVAWFSK